MTETPDGWDDNPEWTEEDFARARPADEVVSPEILAQLMRPVDAARSVPSAIDQGRRSPEIFR